MCYVSFVIPAPAATMLQIHGNIDGTGATGRYIPMKNEPLTRMSIRQGTVQPQLHGYKWATYRWAVYKWALLIGH